MTEKTYEMLWDCKYCGAKKNLGLSHKHCPQCGAPQDHESRYFPSDAEKVAVEDHQYAGADVRCGACGEANGAKAGFCRNCGAPLQGAQAVQTRADQVHLPGAYAGDTGHAGREELIHGRVPPPPPVKKGVPWLAIGCVTVLVAIVGVVLAYFFWTRSADLVVQRRTWERTIAVERFGEVSEEDWCDEVPPGARVVGRSQKQRSTKQVEVGQDCKTRKVDKGDGTFSEKQECTPKYESEPVMDASCQYFIRKWSVARTERASGGEGDEPSWPTVTLGRTGQCDGCEREGARVETLRVELTEPGRKEPHECTVDAGRWGKMTKGSKWTGSVRKMSDGLDCASLKAK